MVNFCAREQRHFGHVQPPRGRSRMTVIDKILFWLFVVFGGVAAVTGVFALNVAPMLFGLALILAAMLYLRVVTGIKALKDGLELLRGTMLLKQGTAIANRGEEQ